MDFMQAVDKMTMDRALSTAASLVLRGASSLL